VYREFGFFGRAVPDSLQEETGAPLWLNTEDPFCIVAVGVQASLVIFQVNDGQLGRDRLDWYD
jgi:hypothetical protein